MRQHQAPDKPHHFRRLRFVLYVTMVHELGHAAVANALGFPVSHIEIRRPNEALTHISKGLNDVTGQINQNFVKENIQVAVAGVIAELLLVSPRVTPGEVNVLLSRHRNRGDAAILAAALSRKARDPDITPEIDMAVKALVPRMSRIKQAANSIAEAYLAELPALLNRAPDVSFREVLK